MAINVSMVQGESRLIDVDVQETDGSATDLEGASIVWKLGASPFGTATLTKTGVVDEDTEGKFVVTIAPEDTQGLSGAMFHWAEIVLSDNSVIKPFLGTFVVSPQPTGGVTVEQFKARFPEFAPVSDALIGMVLTETVAQIGDTWIERDRPKAQMLLTAHTLTLEGEPGRTNTGNGVGMSGPMKRRKVGDVEVEFAGFGSSAGGSAATGYAATAYGQEFAALMRKNFPTPMAV